jgi:hypothetical protein
MTRTFATAPVRQSHRFRRTRRAADPLVAGRLAALAAVAAGLATLCLVALAGSSGAAPASPRIALVVDGGGRPDAALARARAAAEATERSGGADVTVRVPRTAAQAAADVRYLAARGDVTEVVAVGPAAGAAARAATGDHPRMRFAVRAVVPVTLR